VRILRCRSAIFTLLATAFNDSTKTCLTNTPASIQQHPKTQSPHPLDPSVNVHAERLTIITVAWNLHFTPILRQMQCVSVYISYDNINNRHQGRSSPSYPSLPTTIRLNTTLSTHPHIPPIPIATVSARIPSQEPFPLSPTISPTKPRTSTLVLQLNS
jgi:hypothetical protein